MLEDNLVVSRSSGLPTSRFSNWGKSLAEVLTSGASLGKSVGLSTTISRMSPSRLDTRFRLCSDFLHLPLFFPLIVLRKELVLMKQHLAEKASFLSPSSSTAPPPPYWTSLVESAGCTLSSCSSSSMKLVLGETTVLSCCLQSLPPPPSKSQLMKQVVLTVLRKCKT